MAPPIVTLQDMQQYWQACMSTVTATKTQPAHVSLLPCPPSQDPKAAGVTDEKFRVSAAEKQFLSSLELPFGVPVKGARNEKDMALRYRYFVRIGICALRLPGISLGDDGRVMPAAAGIYDRWSHGERRTCVHCGILQWKDMFHPVVWDRKNQRTCVCLGCEARLKT